MLEVDMKTTIKTLYQKGYNKTQIGRMLGIDRKTVRKVLNEMAQDKVTEQKKQDGTWPSMLDGYREYIETQISKDLSIVRIHQDLQKDFGILCGYTVEQHIVFWKNSKLIMPDSYRKTAQCLPCDTIHFAETADTS